MVWRLEVMRAARWEARASTNAGMIQMEHPLSQDAPSTAPPIAPSQQGCENMQNKGDDARADSPQKHRRTRGRDQYRRLERHPPSRNLQRQPCLNIKNTAPTRHNPAQMKSHLNGSRM